MNSKRVAPVLALALFGMGATGCQADVDETWYPGCEETLTTITLEEATDLGFTATDVLALSEGAHVETIVWSDGSSSELTMNITYNDGLLSYVSSVMEEPPDDAGDVAEIAPVCDDRLEVDVEVTFATDDGSFDEVWTATISSADVALASFGREIDPGSLNGTYDFLAFDPAEYDEVTAWLNVSMSDSGSEGELSEQATKTEGEGDDGVATAENMTVASWGSDSSD